MVNGRPRIAVLVAVILVAAFVIANIIVIGDTTYATAIGIIKTSGNLEIYKAPSTSSEKVTDGALEVTLGDGTQVTILKKEKKWYNISFSSNEQTYEGYIEAKYLMPVSGETTAQISGVSDEEIIVRTGAGNDKEVLRDDLTAVIIGRGKNVIINSEVIYDGEKWYDVSFKYGDGLFEGYVSAAKLSIGFTSSMTGVVRTTGYVVLRQDAGSSYSVTEDGKNIILTEGSEVLITNQKTVDGLKYDQVEMQYNGHTVCGYIADNMLRFKSIGYSITASATETPEVEETVVPVAKPSVTAKPVVKTTAKPVTDSEFKKKLEKEGFPSDYVSKLLEIHEEYPYWEFEAFNTGVEWQDVVSAESRVGLNLLSSGKSADWKSTEAGAYNWKTKKYIAFDGATWVTASAKAVKYYLDPRNFLDSTNIFMFENLSYQKEAQDLEGIENILNGTPMHNTRYTYTDSNGSKKSISYGETFLEAAQTSGVSPYHLASRVKQEVVTSATSMSSSVSGTVSGYQGIYNFYNIGANNSTVAGGAVANGLSWASQSDSLYMRPWNSRYRAIVGGGLYIGENYINVGQDTLYLQKFNVTSTARYNHQYMSNIEAPISEAVKTSVAYGSLKKNMNIVFKIPIYRNLPAQKCPEPSGGSSYDNSSATEANTSTTVSTSKDKNNYLSTLSVSGHSFTNKFVSNDSSSVYTVNVGSKVSSVRINATSVKTTSSVSGTGVKKVNTGTNMFYVTVRSESGKSRKYKIKVVRASSSDNDSKVSTKGSISYEE